MRTLQEWLDRSRFRTVLTRALVPVSRSRRAHGPQPIVAALLSLWIPGAGQLYAGRALAAVLWFVVVGMGYVLILPGLVLHLFCVASAAASASARRPTLAAQLAA